MKRFSIFLLSLPENSTAVKGWNLLHPVEEIYGIGLKKMGIYMGDLSQIGCNSVSDTGSFQKPRTIVYAQIRVPKGFYGPNEVLKNKPGKQVLFERVPPDLLD